MKKIFLSTLSLIFLFLISSCSRDDGPQLRIRNEQLQRVNVSIQTSSGEKLTFNNIESGQTTDYQTTAEGNVTVTSIFQNESVSFLAANKTNYTIIIATGKPPSVIVGK